MAILKHLSSKSTNYGAAVTYLMFDHDRLTNKPKIEDGHLVMRENFLIDGINCHPATFDIECKELNALYHKNDKYTDIKSHHYILSFDPKDAAESKLTMQQAQTLGMEFAKKNFPGHQAVVCTHDDGESHSGNIHVHIVINSLRKLDVERRDYMERPCDSRAGYKHHVTRSYLAYLKSDLMQTCQTLGLNQVNLLKKSRNRRISEKKYWAVFRRTLCHSEGARRPVDVCPAPTGAERRSDRKGATRDLHHADSTHPDSQRPSLLADLKKFQIEVENRKSRKTRLSQLQHSAQSLAYLQEHGYATLDEFNTALSTAKATTKAARRRTIQISSEIDKLNEQLHYTGRYYTHKKTYQEFLRSKDKAKFRRDHRIAISEYESARNWLQTHAKDGTLPSYSYLDTPIGKFPASKPVKEIRDDLIRQRNQSRQTYNTAKVKEKELRDIKQSLEALINPRPHMRHEPII